MTSQRQRTTKRAIDDRYGATNTTISTSVNKRLREAMSVSSVASSVRSGSPTELDTDQDSFHGPSGYRDGPLSSPGGQILVNGVLESPQPWIDFDDHPVAEEDEVDVYEDDYDDYEEPGDENTPPVMPLSERRVSPPPPPTRARPTRAPPPRAPPVPSQGIRAGKRPREAPVASARSVAASRRRISGTAAEAIVSSAVGVNTVQVLTTTRRLRIR